MIHLLLLLLTFISLPISSSENNKQITLKQRILAAAYSTCKIALIPHSFFEYCSTFAHEHAHGLTSGEVIPLRWKNKIT